MIAGVSAEEFPVDDLGDSQVEGPGDLDVQVRAFDDRDPLTEPFDELGVVRGYDSVGVGALVGFVNYLVAESLWRLRMVDESPVEGAADGAFLHLLDRIGRVHGHKGRAFFL